ncbi:MAG: radical SAM protein [Acidobacteriota bacterium]
MSAPDALARALERIKAGERVLPDQLALETVNSCNARCLMCPGKKLSRPRGVMSPENHRHIVDTVVRWGAPIGLITHAGMGEPLLDPGLPVKIAYEKSRLPGASVVVYTNGALLDQGRGEELLASGADVVSVSLNALDPDVYARITGLDRDRTYANVEAFIDGARRAGSSLRTQVSLIPSPHSPERDREDFARYWRERGVDAVMPPLIHWGEARPDGGPAQRFPCLYLWKVLMVDQNGTVKPCCEDFDSSLPLGNLLEDDPDEVFNSPAVRRMRLAQLRGDFSRPGICASCAETGPTARQYWEGAGPLFAPRRSAQPESPESPESVEKFKRALAHKLGESLTRNTFRYPPGVWPPTTPARAYIDRFLERYAGQAHGRVVEFHPGYYRDRFPRASSYHVWNIVPEEGVDVVADIQDARSVADESFDTVVCTHVLSAVRDVWAAGRELWRVLRPGGLLLCTVPCLLQAYAPDPKDYWRFTRDSLDAVFAAFADRRIHAYGNPATVAGSPHYLMVEHFPPGVVERDDDTCPSILGLAAWKR